MRDLRLYLDDILECIRKINIFISGMTFDVFVEDEKTFDAVVRNLEIIGEAMRQLPDNFKMENQNIPWKKVIGMRNIIVHQYIGIDDAVIWKTVHNRLPSLQVEISRLLAQIEK